MGLAVKVEAQLSIEERVARLEADVSHIRGDIADMKLDLKTLGAKIDGVKDSIAETKIWMLLMMGALLGVLARVFHWI